MVLHLSISFFGSVTTRSSHLHNFVPSLQKWQLRLRGVRWLTPGHTNHMRYLRLELQSSESKLHTLLSDRIPDPHPRHLNSHWGFATSNQPTESLCFSGMQHGAVAFMVKCKIWAQNDFGALTMHTEWNTSEIFCVGWNFVKVTTSLWICFPYK